MCIQYNTKTTHFLEYFLLHKLYAQFDILKKGISLSKQITFWKRYVFKILNLFLAEGKNITPYVVGINYERKKKLSLTFEMIRAKKNAKK